MPDQIAKITDSSADKLAGNFGFTEVFIIKDYSIFIEY